VKTSPFHSIKQYTRNVYHNDTLCTEGNNIETENRRPGTAGRPLCDRCASL
jgi:hypothetical protein